MNESGGIELRELPYLDDPELNEVCLLFDKIHAISCQILSACVQPSNASRASVSIVFRILERIVECGRSTQLLCLKGFTRDAGVLLLNVIELRLDIECISLDEARESKWLRHKDTRNRPWTVAEQLKAVFGATSAHESERKMYEHLSMVKHGNPAGGELAHSIWTEGDSVVSKPRGAITRLGPEYLTGGAFHLIAACRASMVIMKRHGVEISQFDRPVSDMSVEVSSLMESRLKKRVKEWIRETNPEIAALEQEEARLVEERNEIAEKMYLHAIEVMATDEELGRELLDRIKAKIAKNSV